MRILVVENHPIYFEDVQATGQRLVSCVGQAPGNNQRMFNLFFASNP